MTGTEFNPIGILIRKDSDTDNTKGRPCEDTGSQPSTSQGQRPQKKPC